MLLLRKANQIVEMFLSQVIKVEHPNAGSRAGGRQMRTAKALFQKKHKMIQET